MWQGGKERDKRSGENRKRMWKGGKKKEGERGRGDQVMRRVEEVVRAETEMYCGKEERREGEIYRVRLGKGRWVGGELKNIRRLYCREGPKFG